MAQDRSQERTERATPKRRRDARARGQVARSRELNMALGLLAASGALLVLGERLVGGLARIMTQGLSRSRPEVMDETALLSLLGDAVLDALLTLAPLLAVMTVVGLFAPAALSGWVFYPAAVAFKWSKLNPIQGLGRIFSWRGALELGKALVKFVLVAAVAGALLWHFAPDLLALGNEPLAAGLAHAGSLLAWAFLFLAAAMLLIAAVDVPFQLWDYARQLRMTRQEVKDELKETEGKPEVKGRIRRLQQEMARRRMMAEVPKADVVVTNPSHYAVALKYDHRRHAAPVVVAKGVERVAAEIRRIALGADVPLVSAPPLARALYHSTALNQAIPAQLYHAVARVLAYVYQLRHAARGRGRTPTPPSTDELPVPPELRRD